MTLQNGNTKYKSRCEKSVKPGRKIQGGLQPVFTQSLERVHRMVMSILNLFNFCFVHNDQCVSACTATTCRKEDHPLGEDVFFFEAPRSFLDVDSSCLRGRGLLAEQRVALGRGVRIVSAIDRGRRIAKARSMGGSCHRPGRHGRDIVGI